MTKLRPEGDISGRSPFQGPQAAPPASPKLSEMPFNTIRIGQVVRLDHTGKYAWVCALDAERIVVRDHPSQYGPRYDALSVQHESGNISTMLFHMICDNMEVIDRVLDDKERMDWQHTCETLRDRTEGSK